MNIFNCRKNATAPSNKALFLLRCLFHRQSLFPVFLLSGIGILICQLVSPVKERFDPAYSNSHLKISCRLIKIIDGDTVIANCQNRRLRIRLSHIDAPEKKQVPWGDKAQKVLESLLSKNFQMQPEGEDVYQRQLGRIWSDKKEINLLMVEMGMAVVYRGKHSAKAYTVAEQKAKMEKVGIWEKPGLQQNPYKWRRYHQ